ncbi:hypothetical protein IT418_03805 [bacterium]|nr:hypothetical protein [bacterium]
MKSAMKIVIVVLILMVTFGLPVLLQQIITPHQTKTTPTPTITVVVDDIRFLSIPPVIVPAGTTFMYKIMTTSLSGEEVTVIDLAKPEWMSWDATTNQLSGTVPDIGGVFTVTMRASVPGGDIEDQTFTVTIDKQEAVKGAKTVALWKDPFHPNPGDIQKEQMLLPETEATDKAMVTLQSDTSVLGEKTVARDFLTPERQKYLLIGVVVLLGIVIISIVGKIIHSILADKSKLPKGIVIERGSR